MFHTETNTQPSLLLQAILDPNTTIPQLNQLLSQHHTSAQLFDTQLTLEQKTSLLRAEIQNLINEVKPTFGYRTDEDADRGLRAYADGSLEQVFTRLQQRLAAIQSRTPNLFSGNPIPSGPLFDNDKKMKEAKEVAVIYVKMCSQLEKMQHALGVIFNRLENEAASAPRAHA